MTESVLVDPQALKVGDALPQREHNCTNVQLMLYNAALWNAHRIHYDQPYATNVEGYPGLVVAGPLLGDWMNQCVDEWLGDRGVLTGIEYSNRVASYIGETLVAGGTVMDWDPESGEVRVEVFIRNEAGDIAAPGVATARLHVN